MHRPSSSSLIGRFKIDNWSITTLFEDEVKYLNLTNYHFSRALANMQLSYSWFLISGTLSRLYTINSNPKIPVLDFTFQFFIQYSRNERKWSNSSQDNKLLEFDKTIQQITKHQMISTQDQEINKCLHKSKIKQQK